MEQAFKNSGFNTYTLESAETAIKKLNIVSPDIIVSELDLPLMSGLDFCRELRHNHNDWTPIILLSSERDELEAVLGLELGADDYIVKPIRVKEVVARAKSILRRGTLCCSQQGGSYTPYEYLKKDMLRNGDLIIDPDHFIVYKNEVPIDFTRKEYELFYYLFMNKGKVLTRAQLIQELSGDEEIDERIIDVFISRIRNKIETNKRTPVYIRTVRHIGYMMKDVQDSQPPTNLKTQVK
nr:response regulator transcription factor [Evansella tamaricis]